MYKNKLQRETERMADTILLWIAQGKPKSWQIKEFAKQSGITTKAATYMLRLHFWL